MDLEIKEEGKGGIEIFQSIPKEFENFLLGSAVPIAIGNKTFTALFQEFKGDGFSAWFNRFWTKKPIIVNTRGDIPVLELRISLQNRIEGTWDKIIQPSLPLYHFNLGFTPYVITRAIFNTAAEYQTFDIHFSISFLESLGLSYKSLDEFLKKVTNKLPAELIPEPYDCNGAMIDAVYAIIESNCSSSGVSHFLRCKVTEILLIALEIVGKNNNILPAALQPGDLKKLERVKELIELSIPNYPGNEFLCRETGLNEFKLTVGFKFLFKITPYDYHMGLKMRMGKQLLLNPENNVEGVAFLLGYDQSSSFIKEFKKMFKYTPGWFQKNGKL
jgi:AraC-like DNA-binding protein